MQTQDAARRPFQLQILPGDPRRPIRQLRLTRRGSRMLAVAGILLLLPIAAGWSVLPWLLYSRFSLRDVRVQVARRVQHGERLQRMVEQLGALGENAGGLERRSSKMRILLDLGPPRPLPAEAEKGGDSEILELQGPFAIAARRGLSLIAAIEGRIAGIGDTLDAIESQVRVSPGRLGTIPSIFPLGGAESVPVAGFGPRRSPFTQELDFHAGIDVAAPIGTPVLAPADGVVAFSGVFERREGDWWRLGQVVALRHGDRFVTLFGHCDALAVRVGERVRRGQKIATVGKSGWSTTIHLHYEIRRRETGGDWIAVDPRLFILDQSWEEEEQLLAGGWVRPSAGGAPLPRSLTR